jgi:DUF4097 and DUF4098 domain-containing protein YvlB
VIRRIDVFFLGIVLAVTTSAREEYSRAFDKTVPWTSGARLYVEHSLGDIAVHTHAEPQVVIHAEIHVSASSAEQAKDFADRVEISVESAASEIGIRTHYPAHGDSFHFMHNISYYVRYDITVPEAAPLQIRNSFGKVSVAGVKANCGILTSHGDLEFRDGRGVQRLEDSFANVRVWNNAGDVTVENSNGTVEAADIKGALAVRDRFANVTVQRAVKGVTVVNSNGALDISDSGGAGDLRNSFGNVTVRSFHGDLTVNNTNGKVEAVHVDGTAELNTTFGDVRFSDVSRAASVRANNASIQGDRVGGPLTIQNSFGAIVVSDIQGAVDVHSANGNVTMMNVHGAANVRTSFGTVEASNVGGMLTVENSNGAVKASNARGAQVRTSFGGVLLDTIAGPLQIENQNGAVDASISSRGGCQPVIIRTSFSPLRVRIDGEASYRVSARTSFGKIRTDFPLTISGSLSNDELNGTIGSGRCDMRLSDSNGAIEILKGGS